MKKNTIIILLLFIFSQALWSNSFKHSYISGEKYRIVTEVDEKVLINGIFLNNSHILNKVSINTLKIKNGCGQLHCHFQLSEQFSGNYNSYVLKSEYESTFWRDQYGKYTINNKYFMPVLRHIPSFLNKKFKIGDTWSIPGEEVHDLRKVYNIQQPFRFPVQVNYTYLRDEKIDGVECSIFLITYTTFYNIKKIHYTGKPVPVKITGMSKKIYYWNIKEGKLHKYDEEFDYIFHLSNGKYIEYTGSAKGKLIKSSIMNKVLLLNEIKKEIKKQKLSNTKISQNKKGVTITLENIRFLPYSFKITSGEMNKLKVIAQILKRFNNRDFLITGHTAKIGSESSSIILSQKRAQAVADFLFKQKSFKKNQVILRGYGSQKPISKNTTEEGRRKNRRVEITILEN